MPKTSQPSETELIDKFSDCQAFALNMYSVWLYVYNNYPKGVAIPCNNGVLNIISYPDTGVLLHYSSYAQNSKHSESDLAMYIIRNHDSYPISGLVVSGDIKYANRNTANAVYSVVNINTMFTEIHTDQTIQNAKAIEEIHTFWEPLIDHIWGNENASPLP